MQLKTTTAFVSVCFVIALAVGLLVVIPWSAVQPVHIPIEQTPADAGLDFEEFTVIPEDKALSLKGWWMPAENAHASLVFIHGGGSNRHSTFFNSVPFYKAMVEAGINVTAIDLRNHGFSDDDPRGLQFGVTEKYDALAAIRWTRDKVADLPVFLMGISMGGATSIHAAASGADIQGLILLDSLLDTTDTFNRGGTAQTGLPHWLFGPAAWSAQTFFGLPSGDEEAMSLAVALELPILVMADPDDPVTRAVYSRELAQRNRNAELWVAPAVPPDHPELMWRGHWGSHVIAFFAFPHKTVERVMQFVRRVSAES
jgi:uncharacterized protein